MRVYLPATVRMLDRWLAAGAATSVGTDPDSGICAYAVTPALRESYHDADLDELEYAAQIEASVGSLRLLAIDQDALRCRVVVAADVADDLVHPRPEDGRASVRVDGPVEVARWASALVDAADAAPVVETAVASLAAAAAGDDDAQFALDEAEALELGWYAVQELPHLPR